MFGCVMRMWECDGDDGYQIGCFGDFRLVDVVLGNRDLVILLFQIMIKEPQIKPYEICHQILLLNIIWKAGSNPKALWMANNNFFRNRL